MELNISKQSADLIISAEISSPAYYQKFLQHPCWPKGLSGVTIGVGYDLGQQTKEKITDDWGNFVSEGDLNLLLSCSGVHGVSANSLLQRNPSIKTITIPLDSAKEVFYTETLPRYAASTNKIYPGLDQLEPDAIGALVSIVFNRGASLAGPDRSEMKSIVPLIVTKNYEAIATLIEHSKRLWLNKPGMQGIVARRLKEAKFVRECQHDYDDNDLIHVEI